MPIAEEKRKSQSKGLKLLRKYRILYPHNMATKMIQSCRKIRPWNPSTMNAAIENRIARIIFVLGSALWITESPGR